jgi:RNA-dependent RNA polymerase
MVLMQLSTSNPHRDGSMIDQISGSPTSLEESCMCLIDSGFCPASCHILAKILKEVFKGVIRPY